MSATDFATVTVMHDADAGTYYAGIRTGQVALVTGPWTTLDALMHHVAGVLAEQRSRAADEPPKAPGCWVV